jgi:RNA polymerase sigma-54 factor
VPGQQQRTDLRQRLGTDPRVVLAARVMEATRPELDDMIRQEASSNPALEAIDLDEDLTEEEVLRQLERAAPERHADDEEAYRVSICNPDERTSWIDFLAAPPSLKEHLLAQLLGLVPPRLESLAHAVVECVGPKGYLEVAPEEIALEAEASLEDVREVVRLLQTCDPPGVGAYDLRECLLIQLKDRTDPVGALARAMVEKHWRNLRTLRFDRIATSLRVSREEVSAAVEELSNLSPYPGEAFAAGSRYGAQSLPAISPDVVYRRTPNGITIEVVGAESWCLRLSRWYAAKYRRLRKEANADPEEKRHVTEFVRRALDLIQSVKQRQRTLYAIAEALLKAQYSFINTGDYHHLKPLMRKEVAEACGFHLATVSRATANKTVQIPTGETLPFEVFFQHKLRVQKLIEEILAGEDPEEPLTDQQIADRLNAMGVKIARRTVAKYRERIVGVSSRKRRMA